MRTRLLLSLFIAALALASATTTMATISVVTQTGTSFVPNDITVTVGDTVRWVWSSLSHTVTNGTNLADPALGTLFDAPLTTLARSFQYRFTTVGVVPYLCRPHAGFGMTGVVRVRAVTAVDPGGPPNGSALFQNSPNPFNPSTRIAFLVASGPATTPVTLRIFDVGGRLVRTLRQGDFAPGRHDATWDGRDDRGVAAASGVYLYRLQVGAAVLSREMTLVR